LRDRTYLAGKIVSNFGQSSIDCIVRRMADDGATVEVESVLDVPQHFHLLIPNDGPPRACRKSWQSERQIGVTFESGTAAQPESELPLPERRSSDGAMRGMMLALRAALDAMETGVVLLDANMKSQFINKAFRRRWALPDEVADRNPAFVALMYHRRDTRAYATETDNLDEYVTERVRLVRDGDTKPINLRRSNGEVIRYQCAVLPNGGRLLSYTYVTDIVRRSDELESLRTALDHIEDGVLLLDADLNAQFINRVVRDFWEISEERAATHPPFAELIASRRHALAPGFGKEDTQRFFAERIARIRSGDPTPCDLQMPDGRRFRAHCTVTANGGRMLTYCDVSDLIQNAQQLETLATIDAMTGLYNRRHFLWAADAEWSRFQRYQRPLSILMIDIDHFKQVNDRYGHAVGDDTIIAASAACIEGKRGSDLVGRIGGEEFAMLLPETDASQAAVAAERISQQVASCDLTAHNAHFRVTVSIGIAEATISMSGVGALMKAADEALYQAKADGRNCIRRWSAPSSPKLAAE
jgi:diguanylate cyclase (GGDEF)-like protein